MRESRWHRLFVAAALVVGGVGVGASLSTTNVARGETRGTPESPAFQSSGQMSVPVLREISATLRQMDARLARLEVTAQKVQAAAARGAVAKPLSAANAAN